MMKNKFLYLSLLGLFCLNSAHAREFRLNPTPQTYVGSTDSVSFAGGLQLQYSTMLHHSPAVHLARKLVTPVAEKSLPLYLALATDRGARKYRKLVPQHAEGYYLQVKKDGIVIVGADERGLYYGVQTLSQLMTLGKLPLATVTDYPEIPYRGVVEGFYGTPWSHEARLRQLEFYGRNKMNVYIYGPKNDPYHSTPNWRKPYPAKEAAQLKELVEKAAENDVIFYWAIHPGQDIRWNDTDRRLLLEKFESMYRLGVRAFAVFFDDISGEGTNASRQAELLNYIDDHFIRVKGDVAPLVMCPTEYNKSWSNPQGGYLTTLGTQLNQDIPIMWTGDRVIACIDQPTLDFINPLIRRKAYIWWNFPVSDYVRDHLLMGPVYGNSSDIKDGMEGFVANPMERAEASKIALYSVADYAWNPDSFDSRISWKGSIASLMPEHAAYLETFAAHHSDLGQNAHGFRREESEELKPFLEILDSCYRKDRSIAPEAFTRVSRECSKVILSADMLLASSENRTLIEEIKPWLIQFKLLGEYGRCVLSMMQNTQDKPRFNSAYEHARAIRIQMVDVDATYNQNPYQPGVKSGSRYFLPTLNSLFHTAVVYYNRAWNASLDAMADYLPYSIQSNVPQLQSLPLRRKGKKGEVSPSNEVILWPKDGCFTVVMDRQRRLTQLQLDLGELQSETDFTLSVSADGKSWKPLTLRKATDKTVLTADITGETVSRIRLLNSSGKEQRTYFHKFAFTVE